MGSNNEYEHIDFWEKVNLKLNQEQERVCIESDKDGKCLMSAQFITFDIGKPFCEQLKQLKINDGNRSD